MSKLGDRMPALANPTERLAFTVEKVNGLVRDGRVDLDELRETIVDESRKHSVNVDLLEEEGRQAIATQCIAQLTHQRTISIDRKSKTPVYQTDFGFAGNWFKVGNWLVAPEAMTLADFDVLIERIEHRIENATIDRDVWADFRERARPGLEAGQNLVQQFEAGTLTLLPADTPVVEADQNGAGE